MPCGTPSGALQSQRHATFTGPRASTTRPPPCRLHGKGRSGYVPPHPTLAPSPSQEHGSCASHHGQSACRRHSYDWRAVIRRGRGAGAHDVAGETQPRFYRRCFPSAFRCGGCACTIRVDICLGNTCARAVALPPIRSLVFDAPSPPTYPDRSRIPLVASRHSKPDPCLPASRRLTAPPPALPCLRIPRGAPVPHPRPEACWRHCDRYSPMPAYGQAMLDRRRHGVDGRVGRGVEVEEARGMKLVLGWEPA
ncbi:hypothetical protein K438DRAFT_2022149 [Mycena galopus ATCC 62051]|nr:hypothetical protein K438DRAFT_2022149 [Mycena galopus ATCC 62051]